MDGLYAGCVVFLTQSLPLLTAVDSVIDLFLKSKPQATLSSPFGFAAIGKQTVMCLYPLINLLLLLQVYGTSLCHL